MKIPIEQAYAESCRQLGEAHVQIAFMAQALAQAQAQIAAPKPAAVPAAAGGNATPPVS